MKAIKIMYGVALIGLAMLDIEIARDAMAIGSNLGAAVLVNLAVGNGVIGGFLLTWALPGDPK